MSQDLPYYYILLSEPYSIVKAENLEELVSQLYEGNADFIMDGQRIELGLDEKYFSLLKEAISLYDERVPMYDIANNHIYLINRSNVYPSIYDRDKNYRFVDENFYRDLVLMDNPSKEDIENRRILSYYDLKILYKTYTQVFYRSFVYNSYITECRRPSFFSHMEHISPYYTIKELYFLAYDWNLTNKATLTEQEINNFCVEIAKHDISAETLLNHQVYIYQSKAIGLVKHYSLFGSYYMNMYLRKNRCSLNEKVSYEDFIRNIYLENQITIMIKLIKNCPVFTDEHTVYRFIESDSYLKHLKIGDIYKDCSFMSTTRNPFYYKENYAFGYIMLKIKLPKNINGIGLCIESYSNFPSEEEIILPPTTSYRLTNIIDNSNSDVEHFHNIFDLEVKKKYEFEWIGNSYLNVEYSDIKLDMPDAYIPEINNIDLFKILSDSNIRLLTISDRLNYFRNTYINNMNNQFASNIGPNSYIFNLESYDSTSVYKPFFYYEYSDGIMITTSNKKYGNINILMELGTEIHVNYYFRYSLTDSSLLVDLNNIDWIEWLSLLAFAVGSRKVIIHSNYIIHSNKTDSIEEMKKKTRYTFSENIYSYLKHGKKFFEFVEMTPNFAYEQLDLLSIIPVTDHIKSTDRNELYRIYQGSNVTNMKDFYLYIVENFPKFIKQLEEKMEDIYSSSSINPFLNISYNLDAWRFLYNKNYIQQIPSDKDFIVRKGSFKKLISSKKIPKFKNRLRTYLLAK